MLILGIDPGTARMGIGLIEFSEKGKIKFLKSEVLITSPDLAQHHRLKFLHNSLLSIIKEHGPEVIVVERLFFNTNVKTAMTVGQARGIVLLAASQKKLDLFEYTALEAKMAITGYGRSDKKQMQEAVKKELKLKDIIKSDDANDAVAMAMCYVKKELLKKEK